MQKIWEQLQTLQLKQADRVAPVLLALLTLYLCWKLASLFWLLVAPPQAMQLDRVELGSQQLRVPNISSFALFHEASQRTQAEDNLNLQLQGVMVGYPNQFSSAVLKVNEVAERYRVGDVIEGSGYQLAEVYWDRYDHYGFQHRLPLSAITGLKDAYSSLSCHATVPCANLPAPARCCH